MKTKSDQWRVTSDTTATSARAVPCPHRASRFTFHVSRFTRHASAFTLIELLVVISIIAVLAAFTIPVLKSVKESQYKKVAKGELKGIETELENYHAKYGVYPPDNKNDPLMNQLYYELSGTTTNATPGYFETLDSSAKIAISDVPKAYGVGGFINCTTGSDEDGRVAQNFLPNLKNNQITLVTNTSWGNAIYPTTELVTSVGGPDQNYRPLGKSGLNPIRYVYPGTHNPKSYDLWVQLVIGGKTNLICNWSDQVQINQPLP